MMEFRHRAAHHHRNSGRRVIEFINQTGPFLRVKGNTSNFSRTVVVNWD